MTHWQVIEGDALTVLGGMPDASVDAIVTDPPYMIGFMGKEFDRPKDNIAADPAFWREARRVLKPGGHLLAFGGTRTFHRLACALEDAGFTLRDTLMWLHGVGFPKSLDVSKAIDKAARRDYVLAAIDLGLSIPGNSLHDWTKAEHSPSDEWWGKFKRFLKPEQWKQIEREVIGRGFRVRRESPVSIAGISEGDYDITAPATDAARQWQGFGTALKPAWEPILLCRAPLSEKTIAANVLKHGTGALNIDGCRIAGDEDGSRNRPPSSLGSCRTYAQDTWTRNTIVKRQNTTGKGRFPANLVFSHAPECEEVGERAVKSSTLMSGKNYERTPRRDYGADGTETVTAWRCVPGCPVAELDRQSGDGCGAFAPVRGTEPSVPATNVYGTYGRHVGAFYGDTGGASRFFYTAKASRTERTTDGATDNRHPTVKPLALMRWLCRLIMPPGGTVLDPFCGSGTTGIAALAEGFSFIGIERELEYVAIAKARIVGDAPLFNAATEAAP